MASQLYADLVEFLVGVSTTDENTTYAETLLAAAQASIAGSGAGLASLTSSGINGKTFSRAIHLSALEIARACQEAIAIYNDETTEVSATYPDFRCLQR